MQRLEAEGRLDLELGLDPQARLLADLRAQEPPGGVLATALGIPQAPADLTLRLDGPASGADLRARAAFGELAGFNAEGRVALDAAGGGALTLAGHLDAPANLAPEPVRAIDFTLGAKLPAGGQPELENLRLSARAGEITARGSLALLEAEARIANSAELAPLVPEIIGWEGITLTARVEDGERIQAQLRPRGLRGPDPMGAVLGPNPEADYRGTAFRIDSLEVRGQGARLHVEGSGWDVLDLTARLDVPELKAIRPELSGPIAVDARVTGPAADPAIALKAASPGLFVAGRRVESPELVAEIPSVSGMAGTLRLTGRAEGQPIALALRAAQEGDLVRLAEGDITFGPIRGRGRHAEHRHHPVRRHRHHRRREPRAALRAGWPAGGRAAARRGEAGADPRGPPEHRRPHRGAECRGRRPALQRQRPGEGHRCRLRLEHPRRAAPGQCRGPRPLQPQ
ncbi:translocation/assembly module TamB domain-containing protein [Teichococcus aestuarii]|uniref:hypothetical protein n=1 Tax=Teichococcus aestuarii TaxID=568898 RepID=UPI00361246EE